MPTYEYECQNCKFKFEKFQNMTDAPLETCPKCGGKLKRVISGGAGVIFKGPGFYATDYKNTSVRTCCGRTEPCEKPPCADDGICKR